ncbi:MAG: DUF4111 domain-containing protein [Actinobacteria bacterium]|nr:DUF4111 domain-containing protein [Actinomycetota bacterium]
MNEVESYLASLAERLRGAVGADLVGVYAGGSYALGAYEDGTSDLDVAAVTRRSVPVAVRHAVVEAVRHEALPCPARGLELVLYPLEVTRGATTEAGFELNLNTGRALRFRAELEPGAGGEHWFPIDRSILAASGVALYGPPAAGVFTPLSREQLLPVLIQSLRWHERGDARPEDAVLNACRALRFAAEGAWSSKAEAGRWALGRAQDSQVVGAALAARGGGAGPDRRAASDFVRTSAALLNRAREAPS